MSPVNDFSGGSMRKTLLAISTLFVLVSASFAVTPSNASLKGTYSFQLGTSHFNSWQVHYPCPNPNGGIDARTAGSFESRDEVIIGNVTFDGKGNAIGTYTQYGQFDYASSIGTVDTSCPFSVNSGHAVYFAPVSGTFTGLYTIGADGYRGVVTYAVCKRCPAIPLA